MEKRFSNKGYIAYKVKQIAALIDSGNLNMAQIIIDDLEEKYKEDIALKKQQVRIKVMDGFYEEALDILEGIREDKIFEKKATLYIKLNKDKELYELWEKYYKYQSSDNYSRVFFQMKTYLDGRFSKEKIVRNKLTYFNRQIAVYQEEEALEHIKEKHGQERTDEKTYFLEHIDIDLLFKQISQYISLHPEDASLYSIVESYLFKYPGCGSKRDDGLYDYIEARTFINSPNIITMFPCKIEKNKKIILLKQEEKLPNKVLVKTGRERFLSKYGK